MYAPHLRCMRDAARATGLMSSPIPNLDANRRNNKPRTQEGPCLREFPLNRVDYLLCVPHSSTFLSFQRSMFARSTYDRFSECVGFVVVSQKRGGKGREHNHSPKMLDLTFTRTSLFDIFEPLVENEWLFHLKKECRIHFYSCLCFWSGEKSESRRSSPPKPLILFHLYLTLWYFWSFSTEKMFPPPKRRLKIVDARGCVFGARGESRAHHLSLPNPWFSYRSYLVLWYYWVFGRERVSVPPKKALGMCGRSWLSVWSEGEGQSASSLPTKFLIFISIVPHFIALSKFQSRKSVSPT